MRDTSYSGVTSAIQGNVETGIKALIEIAEEIRKRKKSIEQIEKELRTQERELGMHEQAVKHVFKHLDLELPQCICCERTVYIFRGNNVIETIELIGSLPPLKIEKHE